MIVSMWMAREVVTVEKTLSISQALALMIEKRIRRMPVVDRGDGRPRLAGIVSITDIRRAFPADVNPYSAVAQDIPLLPITVSEVMSHDVETTTPDAPIEAAAAQMRERGVSALPVMREGTVVGLITESDIFRAFVSVLHSPIRGARVTFDASQDDDLFTLVGEYARKHDVRVLSLMTTEQHGRPVCVVRLAGAGVDRMVDELWRSKHTVLNVLHMP